nr:hypothetical protein Iba_chr08dCG11810 [Ipomoea batatas]
MESRRSLALATTDGLFVFIECSVHSFVFKSRMETMLGRSRAILHRSQLPQQLIACSHSFYVRAAHVKQWINLLVNDRCGVLNNQANFFGLSFGLAAQQTAIGSKYSAAWFEKKGLLLNDSGSRRHGRVVHLPGIAVKNAISCSMTCEAVYAFCVSARVCCPECVCWLLEFEASVSKRASPLVVEVIKCVFIGEACSVVSCGLCD